MDYNKSDLEKLLNIHNEHEFISITIKKNEELLEILNKYYSEFTTIKSIILDENEKFLEWQNEFYKEENCNISYISLETYEHGSDENGNILNFKSYLKMFLLSTEILNEFYLNLKQIDVTYDIQCYVNSINDKYKDEVNLIIDPSMNDNKNDDISGNALDNDISGNRTIVDISFNDVHLEINTDIIEKNNLESDELNNNNSNKDSDSEDLNIVSNNDTLPDNYEHLLIIDNNIKTSNVDTFFNKIQNVIDNANILKNNYVTLKENQNSITVCRDALNTILEYGLNVDTALKQLEDQDKIINDIILKYSEQLEKIESNIVSNSKGIQEEVEKTKFKKQIKGIKIE